MQVDFEDVNCDNFSRFKVNEYAIVTGDMGRNCLGGEDVNAVVFGDGEG